MIFGATLLIVCSPQALEEGIPHSESIPSSLRNLSTMGATITGKPSLFQHEVRNLTI